MVVVVLALVLPLGVKGTGTLTAPLLVVRWFTARRGRAMMLSQLGLSLGGLVMPPLAGFLIERFGWREAAAVLGVGGGAALLAIALTTRDMPRPGELEAPASATPAGHDEGGALSFASIVARPAFWTINLSCAVASGISMALMISLVPYGRQLGLSTIQAAAIISAMSASGIVAKLALAFVADRINRLWLLGLLFLGGGALNAALLGGSSYAFMLAIAVGLGIVNSAVTPLQFAANADRFGAPSFGAVSGLAVPLTAVVGALAVRFAGEVFDRTGNYDLLFQVFAVIQAAAALLVVATRFDMPGARLCWPRRRVSGHR